MVQNEGNPHQTRAPEDFLPVFWRAIRWLWSTLIHQALAVVAVYIIWVPVQILGYKSLFFWHIVLCTLGFVPLMAESILLFESDSVWIQSLSRRSKYLIHGTMLTLITGVVVTGITCEIFNNSTHFTSIHSQLGLAAIILLIITVVMGFMAANAQSMKTFIRPVWFKLSHNIFGQAAFIVGVVSLDYGMKSHFFLAFSKQDARTCVTVAIIITAAWTIITPLKSAFRQIKTIVT